MKKPIKFRQFYGGKFHYWGFVQQGMVTAFVSPISLRDRSDQCTGLYDKNGREIYEGDILKKQDDTYFVVRNVIEDCYWLKRFILDYRPSQVIGNVYENPELMMR